MSLVTVTALSPGSITASGHDTVVLLAAGTVNVTGTAANPIAVTLDAVTGGLLGTFNLQYADVTLSGAANISAALAFNVGDNSTLRINSAVGVTAGSSIDLTGANSRLVVGNGVNLAVFGGIKDFGVGRTIDLTNLQGTRVGYVDRAGANTGGTLTVYDANNTPLSVLNLSNGDFTASSFSAVPDGSNGTLISFNVSVTGATMTSTSTTLGLNGVATIAVTTSSPVVVTGSPTLTLNDGGTAVYDPATSSGNLLNFKYTVGAGQNTTGLAVTGVALNSGTLTALGGGTVDLSGVTGITGGLAVDTLAPTTGTVSALPNLGVVGPGQIVTINVPVSEAVTVSGGTPILTLNDGGVATFDSTASTSTQLVFRYTVLPGQNTTGLAITGATNNGATVADVGGNPLNLNALANLAIGVGVNTATPVQTGVAITPGSGSLGAGQMVAITATVSAPVIVSGGTPTLTLSDGGVATFDPTASTSTALVFRHTVLSGQNTPDLTVTAAALNGATIQDSAGNSFDITTLVGNPPGVLAIDTTAPTVTAVTTDPGSGTLNTGQVVHISVSTSEAVTMTGTAPTLTLSDGGIATYNAATSTPTTLVFDHTVTAGQNTADLSITSVNVAGSSIRDAAANLLNLNAVIGNPPGVLVVDTTPIQQPVGTAPAIINVALTPGTGNVVAGNAVRITLTTNVPVTVSGTPVLALSDGGSATYNAANSTGNTLVFDNVVQANETSPDLAIVGSNLNGATITDGNGNALSLFGAAVNPPGILTVNADTTGTGGGGTGGGGTDPGTDPGPSTGGTSITPTPTYGSTVIYRFFDSVNGTHFYTPSASERDSILQNRPDLVLEGPGGVGLRAVDPSSGDPSAVQVFRFFDKVHGTQFLTASVTERDDIIASRSDLTYEPNGSFYEHAQPQDGDTAVYRFFSSKDGTHFYTDSATERATILQTRPDLVAEGIGFYEPKQS